MGFFLSLKATNAICGPLVILNVLSFPVIGHKDLVAKFCLHDVCANLVILLEVGGSHKCCPI